METEKQSFTPPQTDRYYEVRKTSSPLVIDGSDSDSLWAHAHTLTDFRFPWQDREAPPTRFRALWDEAFIYFQFIVVDADVVLAEEETHNKSVIGSDRVELFFAVNDELNPYYSLEMDPRGWNFEAICHLHRDIDSEWSWPGLETVGSLTEEGYILEGKLPFGSFTDLKLWQDDKQRALTTGVFRAEFDHLPDGKIQHNWISWIQPDAPKPDFHIPSAFGRWVLVE